MTAEQSERLGRIEEKVDRLVHSVEGNGQRGLTQRVGSLERARAWLAGAAFVVATAIGVLGKPLLLKLLQ